MSTHDCLSLERIDAYLIGALDEKEMQHVRHHLDGCSVCHSIAEELESELESVSSDLIQLLRQPAAAGQYLDEPEFRRALDKVDALRHGGPAWSSKRPSSQFAEAETLPRQLGQYQLLERLGQGGMGTVYKALHTKLRRDVVVKVLSCERKDDPNAAARFRREMEALGKLDHPHIVRATDASEVDGTYFLVMELVDGLDLERLAKAYGPLPIADACELIRQAALGLEHAHQHEMVHRDIKPSNLILARDGVVKVLDLGLARLQENVADKQKLTTSGQVVGTFDYVAPEQWSDAHAVDIRADIYGLGCTLYKLLTGHAPFSGPDYDTPIRKMTAHIQETPPPIRQHRPDVPGALTKVIARLLAKKPTDRYATPADVAEALEPFTVGSHRTELLREASRIRADQAEKGLSAVEEAESVPLAPIDSTRRETDDRIPSASPKDAAADQASRAEATGTPPGAERRHVSFRRHLLVTAGPDVGRVFEIKTGELLLVGRGEGCQIQLNDPRASKVHCRIHAGKGKTRIVDAGSRWGTVVNGHQVTEGQLQPGDIITLGATELRVEFVPKSERGGHQS